MSFIDLTSFSNTSRIASTARIPNTVVFAGIKTLLHLQKQQISFILPGAFRIASMGSVTVVLMLFILTICSEVRFSEILFSDVGITTFIDLLGSCCLDFWIFRFPDF